MEDGRHFFGTYGVGVMRSNVDLRLEDRDLNPIQKYSVGYLTKMISTLYPPFPSSLKPLTLDELKIMEEKLDKQISTEKIPIPYATYFGEDWKTQGDWTGRIYRESAIACAVQSPFDGFLTYSLDVYYTEGSIGPNHPGKKDTLRLYNRGNNNNLKTLWLPTNGVRRQAEWDDHGEAYPWHIDGPDIWYLLEIKHKGTFRISMYFVNPDGHSSHNRMRDYLIEFYPTDMKWIPQRFTTEPPGVPSKPIGIDMTPLIGRNGENLARQETPLARSRVCNFWGGVHVQFIVTGEHNYLVKIDRNYSFNTIMSSITVDQIFGEPTRQVKNKYGIPQIKVPYDPPFFPEYYRQEEGKQIYENWKKLDSCYGYKDGIELQRKNRILLYQSATAMSKANEKDKLLARLAKSIKWRLNQWDDEQRKEWNDTMQRAWKKLYESHEGFRRAADEDKNGTAPKDPLKNRKRVLYD
jgi:hypothetical protein